MKKWINQWESVWLWRIKNFFAVWHSLRCCMSSGTLFIDVIILRLWPWRLEPKNSMGKKMEKNNEENNFVESSLQIQFTVEHWSICDLRIVCCLLPKAAHRLGRETFRSLLIGMIYWNENVLQRRNRPHHRSEWTTRGQSIRNENNNRDYGNFSGNKCAGLGSFTLSLRSTFEKIIFVFCFGR